MTTGRWGCVHDEAKPCSNNNQRYNSQRRLYHMVHTVIFCKLEERGLVHVGSDESNRSTHLGNYRRQTSAMIMAVMGADRCILSAGGQKSEAGE